jgi:hypothetical protein
MPSQPRFREGPTTLAHIIFDGTGMIDTTGHTSWTAQGSPGAVPVGVWAPTAFYSGPFLAGRRWVGDVATKDWIDAGTSGDFLVCARFRPGDHPGSGPTKIIIASGNPEGIGGAGWSLMQMLEAYCFHYHDTSIDGEWMSGAIWDPPLDVPGALLLEEWSYICGGRSGSNIRVIREGGMTSGVIPMSGQSGTTVGPMQRTPDLPTIGSYLDGRSPLTDGGVFEIIITSDPATLGTAANMVAAASGGVSTTGTLLVPVTGADGGTHLGPPSTVDFRPGGFVTADREILWGRIMEANPQVSGACIGIDARADWAALPANVEPLQWLGRTNASSSMLWKSSLSQCVKAYTPATDLQYVCGTPPPLESGSRHTFMQCYDPADSRLRMYADGNPVPFAASSSAVPLASFPRLDDLESTFRLAPVSSALLVYRIFACPTADPTRCR